MFTVPRTQNSTWPRAVAQEPFFFSELKSFFPCTLFPHLDLIPPVHFFPPFLATSWLKIFQASGFTPLNYLYIFLDFSLVSGPLPGQVPVISLLLSPSFPWSNFQNGFRNFTRKAEGDSRDSRHEIRFWPSSSTKNFQARLYQAELKYGRKH